jgi:hypothetical protein
MKIDTITMAVSGALLALALLVVYAGYLRRRRHGRRLVVTDLLRDYFSGDMPAQNLRSRTREIASHHFIASNEFYALAVSAFRAVDSTLTSRRHVKQKERKVLNAMANLKQVFGLTDRYQVEAWRPWRE